jgi:RNA polymerase sigma-70 factor (ECF subfamily)
MLAMTEKATAHATTAGQLLARIAQGDDAALADLYDAFSSRLHGYARALVRAEVDADEALQETFLGLLRNRKRLDAVADPLAYLFRAVRNAALAARERARRRGIALDAIAEPFLVARTAERAHEQDEVNALLAALPDEQREVVVLRVYAEMTFEEIAAVLSVSINTAASRWRYAAEKLRARKGGS